MTVCNADVNVVEGVGVVGVEVGSVDQKLLADEADDCPTLTNLESFVHLQRGHRNLGAELTKGHPKKLLNNKVCLFIKQTSLTRPTTIIVWPYTLPLTDLYG